MRAWQNFDRASAVTFVVAWITVLGVHPAKAHGPKALEIGPNGLPALGELALPHSGPIAVAGRAAFGLIEPIADDPGPHQRFLGTIALGLPLTRVLSVSGTLRGHYDKHPDDAQGADDSLLGTPSLALRAVDQQERLSWGGELTVDLPGENAPSVKWSATSATLKALLSYTPTTTPLDLGLNVGFRWDNSANAAPDLETLRPGDRIALGLSDFHSLPIALGTKYAFTHSALLAELSSEILLGAPKLTTSPSRIGVGYRHIVAEQMALELFAAGSLSQRPDVTPQSALIPIEPRVSASLGLTYSFERPAPRSPEPEQPPIKPFALPPPPVVTVAEPEPPPLSPVAGVVRDAEGRPLAQVTVVVRIGEDEWSTMTDGDGKYAFEAMPVGQGTLSASTVDFEPSEVPFSVTRGGTLIEIPPIDLRVQQTLGAQLRGLIQSFEGDPLRAKVKVSPPGKDYETGVDGRFTIDVAPGQYTVEIRAPGYASQTRSVVVGSKAVVIVNADLLKRK